VFTRPAPLFFPVYRRAVEKGLPIQQALQNQLPQAGEEGASVAPEAALRGPLLVASQDGPFERRGRRLRVRGAVVLFSIGHELHIV
jgi:hypothetical protein